MDGREQLLTWFDEGKLVRPTASRLNFVYLVSGLAGLVGVEGLEGGDGADEICERIGLAEHYLLVLVDGLGTSVLEKLPPDSFMRRNLVAELQAVFPSTTAAALTTLATGQWPGRHGVPGWWTHLEEPGLTATTLPFVERFSGTPLHELGVTSEDLFPVPSFWNRTTYSPCTVVPDEYIGTVFSAYATGGTTSVGYSDIEQAFVQVGQKLVEQQGRSFSYLYLPQVDDLAHKKGVSHPEIAVLVAEIDQRLARLAADLAGDVRIIVTADHGLVDAPEERRLILDADDPLLTYLECPPSMEQVVPAFHVRDDAESEFATAFANHRLGDFFTLITAADADELRLFGPEPLCSTMRRRIGKLIGVAAEPTALYFRPRRGKLHVHIGVHAGLSPEEMFVPFIVA
jgi:hypothetical protein